MEKFILILFVIFFLLSQVLAVGSILVFVIPSILHVDSTIMFKSVGFSIIGILAAAVVFVISLLLLIIYAIFYSSKKGKFNIPTPETLIERLKEQVLGR